MRGKHACRVKSTRSERALSHIIKNYHKKSRFELIVEVQDLLDLAYPTVKHLYDEVVKNRLYKPQPIKFNAVTEEPLYHKGRKRQFFKFDDSNLYVK